MAVAGAISSTSSRLRSGTSRSSIVRDALARLAGLPDVEVTPGVELGSERYRTTLRCGVVDGRLGFRSHHSHDIHGVDDCLVATDAVAEIVRDGRFGAATEVVVRAGAGPASEWWW